MSKKPLPISKQKAVWNSVGVLSAKGMRYSLIFFAPYLIVFLWHPVWSLIQLFLGSEITLGTKNHDMTIWAIIAGIGFFVFLLSASLRILARIECKKLLDKAS
jgi:glycerol-3-phosphate acyltransferase PlsY